MSLYTISADQNRKLQLGSQMSNGTVNTGKQSPARPNQSRPLLARHHAQELPAPAVTRPAQAAQAPKMASRNNRSHLKCTCCVARACTVSPSLERMKPRPSAGTSATGPQAAWDSATGSWGSAGAPGLPKAVTGCLSPDCLQSGELEAKSSIAHYQPLEFSLSVLFVAP